MKELTIEIKEKENRKCSIISCNKYAEIGIPFKDESCYEINLLCLKHFKEVKGTMEKLGLI